MFIEEFYAPNFQKTDLTSTMNSTMPANVAEFEDGDKKMLWYLGYPLRRRNGLLKLK